jgi:hypothetical protein
MTFRKTLVSVFVSLTTSVLDGSSMPEVPT